MARLLALEWDAKEARVAVAQRRGKDVIVEQAFSVELAPRDPGQTFADTNVGERVASALAARRVSRAETLVAVGRASIELRLLTIPPAPAAELPEMVRFQALRQFSALGEDWPLDFVPLQHSEETGSKVLAATISPDLVTQIRQTCDAAGLTPRRLVLRPFAAASLLRRRDSDGRCRLMVDMLTDEADLTVLVDQNVAFLRTVRLSVSGGEELNRALLAEIRRTMVAAQNQLGGRRVEQIVLFGDGKSHEGLLSQLEQNLSVDVEFFNPFSGLRLHSSLASADLDNPGRFAPLLGMLIDEAAGTPHAIDFLHPRRKPTPPNVRRRNIMIGAGVGALLLLLFGIVWVQVASLDRKIDDLTEQKTKLESTVKAANERLRDVGEIDQWARSDITWLEELHDLSVKFPPAEEAIITQLTILTQPTGDGRMLFDGAVRETSTIAQLEESLRDPRHEVRGEGGQPEQSLKGYNWQFKESVTVKPADDARESVPAAASARPGGIRPAADTKAAR